MAGITTGNRAKKGRSSRKLPSFELPYVEDQSVRRAFESIAEYLRTYEGEGNAPKERFVTLRELEESGLVDTGNKSGYAYISKALGKNVAQKAGSTANPTLKGTTKKDTALGPRTPGGGGGGASDPIEQGKRGIIQKLSDIANVAVASPAQADFLYYDGGKWKNYSLFKRNNRWRGTQQFDGNVSGANLNISNWDTAYGWGDHSVAGYAAASHTHVIADITDFTDNSANWDTAYGWGDHDAVGYVQESDNLVFTGSFELDNAGGTNLLSLGNTSDLNESHIDLWASAAGLKSVIKCTNGNLHIDPAAAKDTYLSWFEAGDLILGDGSEAQTGRWYGTGQFITAKYVGGRGILNNINGSIDWNNAVYQAIRPQGDSSYYSGSANETGYLLIELPPNIANSMLTFEVHGYNYATTDTHWGVKVSGYAQSSGGWHTNLRFEVLYGVPPFDSCRYYDDTGDDHWVTLGESTTNWNYPQIEIRNVIAGYVGSENVHGEWNLSISATAPNGALKQGPEYAGPKLGWNDSSGKNLGGNVTISTSAASGGQDGDIHFKY